MDQLTVFTTVLGYTDPLHEPPSNSKARFICFTDCDIQSKGWQLVKIERLDGKYAADGRRHWHVQHPRLGNAVTLPRFVRYFPQLALDATSKGVEIINASRDTALTCFPRAALEDVLSSPPA